MNQLSARLAGVELYFEDLATAKTFYAETLDLKLSDEQPGHHAKFESGAGFICLEKKGVESYPSKDKAVLLFEVPDLSAAIATVGYDRMVRSAAGWAELHDPQRQNIHLILR